MAGLYQWKKYNLNRVNNWSESFTPHKASYDDNYILTTAEKDDSRDCMVYLGYRIEGNGDFTLTRPKRAEEVRKNDVVYGYIHERVSYPYYATYPEYEQYGNEKKNEIGKFTIKDPGYAESTPWQDDGAKLQYWYQYSSGRAYLEGNIKSVLRSTSVNRGSYIGTVQGQEGAFPLNGQKDGFWYVYDKALNEAPYISGSDHDLGSKDSDFSIDYVVSDSDGDVVTVDILVDDIAKVKDKRTPLGVNQKYLVKLEEFSLGDHKIKIRARDSKGAEAPPRTYYFSKANTAPKISGADTDLGAKSTGFTITYRVDDKDKDPVSVRISLDDVEMASISNAQGKDLRFTLDDEKVRGLKIGKSYTITIKADDGKGGVAYRRYSFTKVNTPPIISGVDSDLGKIKDPVTVKFSVSDVEKDEIHFKLLLDGMEVMSEGWAMDGKEYSYKIDHDRFIRLTYGKHELKLLAWDDMNVNNKAIRIFTFERISGGLDVEVKLAEYNTKPKKIVAVPHGDFIDTKIFQVLACNNYLDSKPTWEDITNMSKIARAFTFTNTTKTAGKWALGVRVIIENGQADISSVLRGIKGGIE